MSSLSAEWRDIKAIWRISPRCGHDRTEVWLTGGKRLTVRRPVAQVLEELAGGFGLDLGAVTRQCSGLMQRYGPLPLPLQRELVLLPVTAELPVKKRTRVQGYVVQSRIVIYEAIPGTPGCTRVYFDDRTSLLCLQGVEEIRQLLTDGEILKKALWGLYLITPGRSDTLREPALGLYLGAGEGKKVAGLG